MAKFNPMAGPIPGENYTSDTKNYPWHRPPEHDDLDSAIEASADKLLSREGSIGVLTMLENGVDALTLADIFITNGIGKGKWTPDFGLLMAGPITHIIYIMGKTYGIDCKLGVKDELKMPTKSFFDGIKRVKSTDSSNLRSAVESILPEIKASMNEATPGSPASPMVKGEEMTGQSSGGGFLDGPPVTNEGDDY